MDEKVKELLEKARLTAGLAADTAVKAAGVVTQKGGQIVEKTRRSFQVFDLIKNAICLKSSCLHI